MSENQRTSLAGAEAISAAAQKRAQLAGIVFFASFALGQVGPILSQPYGAKALFLSVPLMLLFYGVLAFFVARGKNWARILAAIIVGAALIVSILIHTDEAIFLWLSSGQAVMWVAFLFLAFTEPGAAKFRK